MVSGVKMLLCKICQATTVGEILSYEQELSKVYSELVDNLLENNEFYIVNFEDVKMLYDLNSPMMKYYGTSTSFYKECGIVFLEKYNPKTLRFLELSVLFYTLQILKWVKTDYWNNDVSHNLFYESENSLLLQLWNCFNQIINKEKDNDRYVMIYSEQETKKFYLKDEHYEEILDLSLDSFKYSRYSCLIQSILGNYRTRFNKYQFILEYQPMFVEVGYRYLLSLI